jgi:excisionase family DNA binding protein
MEHTLSEQEAAKQLGVSRWTLLRARRRGEVGHYRIGKRRVRYARHHLAAYCHRVEVAAAAA